MIVRAVVAILIAITCLSPARHATAQANFNQAKTAIQRVYADYPKTFYCNCDIQWTRGSSGKPVLQSCGYQVRKSDLRAHRIEWEHVVPAHTFGQQRECWRNGGRANCTANDPVFNAMEADMHNLVPAIGEVNGDRSNFRFAMLPQTQGNYGACPVKIDFQQRAIEPRAEIRGDIARINFYMYDRYGLRLSRQQEQLFMAWDKMDPASEWERIRDQRIARVAGHSNPYVTGDQSWSAGHKTQPASSHNTAPVTGPIKGNRNSNIYHLPEVCPGYHSISPSNTISFQSEAEAQRAGYRKARNCRQ